MEIENILKEMTLEEKCRIICGYTNMSTFPIERLSVRSLVLSDGPNGLRIEKKGGDSLSKIDDTLPSTCFPSGVNVASSWDENLAYDIGNAIGEEALHYGVNIVLGPAINIKRNPLGGRNFEYYSEDPYLAGWLAKSYIQGVQDNGVGCCVKHFACNNNEKYRFVGDSLVDKRALNEIYLKPFEIAVKEAKPYAIMTAYNKVNGTHCSENGFLQNDILRKKWGFDGLSMTDWGGIVSRDKGLMNGTDLEMPGQVYHSVKIVMDRIKDGTIPEETLDEAVRRILFAICRTTDKRKEADFEKHYRLAVDAVGESAVLLRNENGLLPLNRKEKFLVIGDFFDKIRYQGSGSALLNPYKLYSHHDVFDKNHVSYEYVKGYKEEETEVDPELENEALEKAGAFSGTILFFGGLNDYVESEGFDRENLHIPENQVSLLQKLVSMKKKVVFVLHNGSVVEDGILDKVDAVLDLLLPGEGGAEGCFNLLFGNISPSGKLAETWVNHYGCVPYGDCFASSKQELYKESVFVGYRNYQTSPDKIRYPFGFGLSYSKFEYSSLEVKEGDDGYLVFFQVKNVGNFDAKEISQVYVSHKSSLMNPGKVLVGFNKVFLKKGEEKRIQIKVRKEELEIYDVIRDRFVLEQGTYTFFVGPDSSRLPLSSTLEIIGENVSSPIPSSLVEKYDDPKLRNEITDEEFETLLGYKIPKEVKKKTIDMETPICDFHGFVGTIFKKAVCGVGLRKYKKGCKMKDSVEKERTKKSGLFVYRLMPNNSLRSLCYSSSGAFPYPIAKGLAEMCNNHFIKGIHEMLKKEKK